MFEVTIMFHHLRKFAEAREETLPSRKNDNLVKENQESRSSLSKIDAHARGRLRTNMRDYRTCTSIARIITPCPPRRGFSRDELPEEGYLRGRRSLEEDTYARRQSRPYPSYVVDG